MIIFGSVRFLSKKVTKSNFFLKKNRNQTETGSNRPVSVRFGFSGQKPVQTGLARFSRFWLGFFRFWLGFFLVFCRFQFDLVRFFRFFIYKTETEPTGRFFQKFNRFFFGYFFFRFSRFNRFSGFFPHSYWRWKNIQLEKKI